MLFPQKCLIMERFLQQEAFSSVKSFQVNYTAHTELSLMTSCGKGIQNEFQ